MPTDSKHRMVLTEVYGKKDAYDVILRAMEDYRMEIKPHLE